ncbi:hypothetical protein SS1G_00871 [Sclerotinia sclerotiorum 1980 UF-70]|uniref:DSBA-like thioredoxin domain-containing protein n=2 Tax=Sclerotinia sclerotiorum (strain ATCC 18683 / 1980 / Ss-1) TaxID=665079 RepID=A7E6E6_SCLS1|nr:hypothetical protein SS1G_00871 [Sclerotinia sclerotiorum 1980 UF-70]APA07612.1 hypothetical protein sscle_03g023820 [Sclerotinia sclerotiorum 1980 UF-70]EDN91468.1 hypothetical protein SS1G_00871 [Sclerotinia sclerotiorum 1980 UF-70]
MYDSTITFTFDTICPWTYLAKKRLDEALRIVRSTDAASKVRFTIKFSPYQLYPEASKEGEDKYAWYRKSRYGDSDEKMEMYMKVMTAYGQSAGIDYKFNGTVANTLDAHRVIQHFQQEDVKGGGPETANKIVMALYRMYFQEEKHPSSEETLLAACKEAGVDEKEARKIIEDEHEGLVDVKNMIREAEGNGVDSVPVVRFEGRRRDITLEGAQDVGEYVKSLEQIVKESV